MTPAHAMLARLATEVPVDPDAATARQWARTELADPVYHQRPSLLQLVLTWLEEQLAEASAALDGLDARTAALVVASAVAVAAVVALLVAGPVVRSRRSRRVSLPVFGDDTRTAAQLRAAADAHAAAGAWGPAVLDRVRALLRSLEDRALLDLRPGRTAHEATWLAGERLPAQATDLHRAGLLFDDVCYGDAEATAADDAWLRELDARVQGARPVPAGELVGR